MRQEITRAHKGWALDSVVLMNDVSKMMKEDITSAPSEGKSTANAMMTSLSSAVHTMYNVHYMNCC